jgi:hypothetical protein
MMQLKLVKTMVGQYAHIQLDDDGLLNSTAMLKYLVLPLAGTNRIICANSYFASGGTLKDLKQIGL